MVFDTDELIGLIPAAGKGSRLRLPFPKELYPVIHDNHFQPVAQSILEQIIFAGAKNVVFVVNETKHQLLQYFGSGIRFNCNFCYVVQESSQDQLSKDITPGLAEAMDAAYHIVKDKITIFGMPDTIIKPNDIFKSALEKLTEDQDGIFCLFNAEKPEKSGMVILNENDDVVKIVDKPKKTSLTWMWGTVIWKPSFNAFLHKCITQRKITEYSEIFNLAFSAGLKFGSVKFPNGRYLDLGTYDDIARI